MADALLDRVADAEPVQPDMLEAEEAVRTLPPTPRCSEIDMYSARDPDEICCEMAAVRDHLLRDKRAAVARVRTIADWRHHYHMHPWLFCLAASAVGFLLVPKSGRLKGTADEATTLPGKAAFKGQEQYAGRNGKAAGPPSALADALGIALSILAKESLKYVAHRGMEWLELRADRRHEAAPQASAGELKHEKAIR